MHLVCLSSVYFLFFFLSSLRFSLNTGNTNISFLPSGHLINVVVLVLPLRHIVTLYLHILAALLLYMGHQISK